MLNILKVGSAIKFKGFLRNLGKVSGMRQGYFSSAKVNYNRGQEIRRAEDSEALMPQFSVFDLTIVSIDDELPTMGYHRSGHHHLHSNMRYSVKQP